MIYCKWS